jgi:AbrB family looped-hinge helix DNA binding protein
MWERVMATRLVSSKGQIVIPAGLRRRLDMGAGTRVEMFEESGRLRSRLARSVGKAALTTLAGMVKAPAGDVPGRPHDSDPASMLARSRGRKPRGD